MKPLCPKCGGDIAADDVNVAKGVVFCRECNELFSIDSEEIKEEIPSDFDISDVPAGVKYEESFDGVRIVARPRSIGSILFSLIFALGFGGAGGGVLYASVLGSKAGDWKMMLFSIPFLLIGFAAWIFVFMFSIGRTVVEIGEGKCRLFVGVGTLGWTKFFQPEDVRKIEWDCYGTSNGRPMHRLRLVMDDKVADIKFGMFIPEKNLSYVENAIKTLLEMAIKQ